MKKPVHMAIEDFDNLRNKMIKIKSSIDIEIRGTNLLGKEFIGYYHKIVLATNPPHLTVLMYFIHESHSSNPERVIHQDLITGVSITALESIELIEE